MSEYYYQSYLKNELERRIQGNPRYSLRSFANYLDVDSAALSRIINGKKKLTPKLSEKIIEKVEMSPEEKSLFMASIVNAYKNSSKRLSLEVKELLKVKTKKEEQDIETEVFKAISDWHHYAILQLLKEDNFKLDYQWIAKELNINELEAKYAVERMVGLKLIKLKDKKIIRLTPGLSIKGKSFTSSAHKKRIKQVTEKSIYSLENDSINERNHTTMTMAIDPDKLPEAKKLIDQFMDDLSQLLETKHKRVYELQVNLFPLQRGRR